MFKYLYLDTEHKDIQFSTAWSCNWSMHPFLTVILQESLHITRTGRIYILSELKLSSFLEKLS